MKKILTLILLCSSLVLFSSCDTFAVSLGEPSYEYICEGRPIIYVEGIPYYHYWYGDRWIHEIVPFAHRPYIHHMREPRPFHVGPMRYDSHIRSIGGGGDRRSSTRMGGGGPHFGNSGTPRIGGGGIQPHGKFGGRR